MCWSYPRRTVIGLGLALLVLGSVTAHPHLSKRVTARIGNVWVTVSFRTSPANEAHVTSAEFGSFNVGGRLELEGNLKVGDLELKAGPYMLGAVKDGPGQWTMAISPRYEGADHDEIIRLESHLSDQMGSAEHYDFDLRIGTGDSAGRVLLTWHFGSMFLAAPLS